jgi:hypothetical protein
VSLVRSLALAAFALRTNLRSPVSLGGLAAFVAIAGLGPVGSWRTGAGWALDADLLFYGYLTGGLFVLRSGLEQQRETGLDVFLRHNLASPVEHAIGAVLALLGSWLLLTGLLLALALASSAGDAGAALWYTWVFALGIALLVPFVPPVESVATLRIPFILPVLGFLALIVGLSLAVGEAEMVAILGVGAERPEPASSLRLALRVAIVMPAVLGLFVVVAGLRGGRPRFLARPGAVGPSSRHAGDTAARLHRGQEEVGEDHHRGEAGGRAAAPGSPGDDHQARP